MVNPIVYIHFSFKGNVKTAITCWLCWKTVSLHNQSTVLVLIKINDCLTSFQSWELMITWVMQAFIDYSPYIAFTKSWTHVCPAPLLGAGVQVRVHNCVWDSGLPVYLHLEFIPSVVYGPQSRQSSVMLTALLPSIRQSDNLVRYLRLHSTW